VLCASLALLAQRWGGLPQGWPVLRLGAVRYDGKGLGPGLADAAVILLALLLLLPPLAALAGAASVRSVADPHLPAWLADIARLDDAPRLFAPVTRRCTSFSQWWTRATRGRRQAHELLNLF
jgi:hypothetical protein